jgi:NodT family efflux transporter outer membrane factor (OMF) lipoprotein
LSFSGSGASFQTVFANLEVQAAIFAVQSSQEADRQARKPTLKGKPMQQRTNHRSTAIVLGAILGMTSFATVADGQSTRSQLAAEQNWKTVPAGGEVARPADEDSITHWWTVFNDPVLTSLEERALKSNFDLRTALSSIEQARANRLSASGSLLPSVSVTGNASGGRGSSRSGGQVTHNNAAEIDASWEPDFFGRVRKNVAAYDVDIQTAQENLRNTMVSLTAELALDYVNLRSYQSQIAVTQSNLAKYRETYEMTRAKRDSGLTSDLDVEQALETVQSTEAMIPTLEINLQQTKNALAILLAQRPGSLDAELSEVKPLPVVPAEVAVGIPGDLVRRRPDVRSAERQVAAQFLRVGVAKANLYPSFSLSGTFLFGAQNILNVLTPASLGSTVAGSISQTIVNRRNLKAQVKLQNALLDQYEISYDSTLLGAVKDVENSLLAFGQDQVKRKSLASATQSAEQAAEISHELYASGLKDFLTVLDSERTLLTVQNNLVQTDATVDTDLIQLYKALGGGWK